MTRSHGFTWMPRDWRTGTRTLTPELRGIYADMISILHESGGRVPYDADALCAELGLKSVRVVRRLIDALVTADKLQLAGGWLSNRRVTRDLARRAAAPASGATLGGRPRYPQPGDESPPELPGLAGDSSKFAGSLPEVSPKLEAGFVENIEENAPTRAALPNPIRESLSETQSPVPRARDGGFAPGAALARPPPPAGHWARAGPAAAQDRLGDGQPAGPARFTRPETALARLLRALLQRERLALERADALIAAALEPAHPHHAEARRQVEALSRKHRCGFYVDHQLAARARGTALH